MRDILQIVKDNRNMIQATPLLRKSNLSSARFKEYYSELIEKKLMMEISSGGKKYIVLAEKGFRFLEKYRTIVAFIEDFEL